MDLLDLFVKIKADTSEFKKGMSEVDDDSQNLLGKLKTLGTQLAGAFALKEVAQKVAEFTTECVNSYADLQQNVGGIQKLYGNMGQTLEEYAESNGKTVAEVQDKWQSLENAQNMVLENASKAYKTAGMDANTYMQTATSFSASLINSLEGDTEESAKLTDVAMTAIADNWNTFGGDLEGVTNAFMGFAKENYTMLDNLKLGYAGTKTGMQDLIQHASTLTDVQEKLGMTVDANSMSFDNIVKAIQVVQTEQNIAGTTAREATETISGSVNMMKASWENFKTSFANPDADIGESFRQLTETIVGGVDEQGKAFNGVIQNVVPAVVTVFENLVAMIPTLIGTIATGIVEGLPSFINGLSSLINAGIEWLLGQAPQFLVQGVQFVTQLINGIVSNTPAFIASLFNLLVSGIATIGSNLPQYIASGIDLVTAIVSGIVSIMANIGETLLQAGNDALEWFSSIDWYQLGVDFITWIKEGASTIANSIPTTVKEIGAKAFEWFSSINWIELGLGLINKVVGGLQSIGSTIGSTVQSLGKSAFEKFKNIDWLALGTKLVSSIASGISSMVSLAVGAIGSVGSSIGSGFRTVISNALQWGRDLIDNFVQGIRNTIGKVTSVVSSVAGSVKKFLGFSEPEEGPLSNFHTFAPDMMQLFAKGIDDNAKLVINSAKGVAGDLYDTLEGASYINLTGTYSASAEDLESVHGVTSGSTTIGDVQIVVNAKEGQSAKEIADEVMYRMQHLKDRNDAVFA